MKIILNKKNKQKLLNIDENISLRKLKTDILKNREILAFKINSQLSDIDTILKEDDEVEILTFADDEGKNLYWHTSSHILAQAVLRLFPGAKLAIGPAIEEGFYYDFLVDKPFEPDALEKIEKEANKIISEKLEIKQHFYNRDELKEKLKKENDIFKLEILEQDIKDEKISYYRQNGFEDLCRGPHLSNTSDVGIIKIITSSGAYWRGDEKKECLQRIYAISFPDKKQLKIYLNKIEEAKKRDHRKLGKDLDLFSIHPNTIGPGLIIFHPKGALLRHNIEEFLKKVHLKRGYDLVYSPHLMKADIWKMSGHYDNYRENMYFTKIDDMEYGVKPMNCPAHIMVYKSQIRSYRDLPIRLFELGTVYRHEKSGVLHGLLRVRGFTQDDAHIYCTPGQLEEEIINVLAFAQDMIKTFGFEFTISLGTRPEKSIGDEKMWEQAIENLKGALDYYKFDYKVKDGDGAFYGPKIDISLKDALGRLWQGPTTQVDFAQPYRFNIDYIDKDGSTQKAVMIHRTVLGSMERFIGCLIEHYAGAFPVWLAPVQIRLLPISEKFINYTKVLAKKLKSNNIRVEIDERSEKLNRKIRDSQTQKIIYSGIVGEQEEQEDIISIRKYSEKGTKKYKIEELIQEINSSYPEI